MNKKKKQNGFTIVELVIVIAVIGILAAVLIPTFSNLIQKAKHSADRQLVYYINEAVIANEVENGKEATMYETLQVLDKEYGFTIEKMTPRSDSDIVWDSVTNRFALVKDGTTIEYNDANKPSEMANKAKMWKITTPTDSLEDGYSHYLTADWTGTVAVTTGVDVGENTDITSVNYNGTGEAQTVVIRTNGGTLIINDTNPDSEQVFYGYADSVEVTTGSACFTSHGTIGTMDLKAGKAIADSGAYIGLIKAAAGTVAEEKNGGVFVIPTNAVVAEDGTGVSAAVAESLGYTVETVDEVQVFTPSAAKVDNAYFAIYSLETLKTYRDLINSNKEIPLAKVTADFDISQENWQPIGIEGSEFHGTFDGQGHTISGLKGSNSNITWANSTTGLGKVYGLFGLADGGDTIIKNLTLTNVDIELETDGKNMAALLGFVPTTNSHSVTIENVTIGAEEDTSHIYGSAHVAGIIGKYYGSGKLTISGCKNYANVTEAATGGAAGIVGFINKNTLISIDNCANYGTISAENTGESTGVGGIVGYININGNVTFTKCKNTGKVTGNKDAGGILGASTNTITFIFDECENTGDITSNDVAGGIFGSTDSKNVTIELKTSVKNTGTITATNYASNFLGWYLGLYGVNNYNPTSQQVIECVTCTNVDFTFAEEGKLVAAHTAKYWTLPTGSSNGTKAYLVNSLTEESQNIGLQ